MQVASELNEAYWSKLKEEKKSKKSKGRGKLMEGVFLYLLV